MPTTRREPAWLSEAARLLRDGLELLEQRAREVDGIVERAHDRARQIGEEARERARAVTADAQRERTALDEQLASLHAELDSVREQTDSARQNLEAVGHELVSARQEAEAARRELDTAREELAQLRAAQKEAAMPEPAPALVSARASEPVNLQPADTIGAHLPSSVRVAAGEPSPLVQAEDAPRWGRPSTTAAAQHALRERGSRPRWLPPWVPFGLLVLALASLVTGLTFVAASR